MGRSPCCERVGLKRGRWTSEEDEILTNYIQANGEGSWRSLPKNAGLLRCGKSCRLRWMNYLRADLKRGNITAQEEETIVKLQSALGNKWSLIAAQLPGRTDNEIKNYWNSHLRRKIYNFTKIIKDTLTKPSLDMDAITTTEGQSKRKGGRTRTSRPASKKHKSVGNYGEGQQSNGIALSSNIAVENSEVLGPCEWLDNEINRFTTSRSSVNGAGLRLTTNGENEMVKQVIITPDHHDEERDANGIQKDDKNDDRERYGIRLSNAEVMMSSNGELDVDYWENYDDQWRLLEDSDNVFCWLFDGDSTDEAGNTPD